MRTHGYEVVKHFYRTVSAVPDLKKLVGVDKAEAEPRVFGTRLGELCRDVVFRILVNQTGDRFWSKQWIGPRKGLLETSLQIESFVATLGRTDCCLAMESHPQLGLIYRFDPELFSSTEVVHQWDCSKYFTQTECGVVEHFARRRVRWPGLPAVSLGMLTDFQVTRTSHGLVFLDFEPSVRYAAELAGVHIPVG